MHISFPYNKFLLIESSFRLSYRFWHSTRLIIHLCFQSLRILSLMKMILWLLHRPLLLGFCIAWTFNDFFSFLADMLWFRLVLFFFPILFFFLILFLSCHLWILFGVFVFLSVAVILLIFFFETCIFLFFIFLDAILDFFEIFILILLIRGLKIKLLVLKVFCLKVRLIIFWIERIELILSEFWSLFGLALLFLVIWFTTADDIHDGCDLESREGVELVWDWYLVLFLDLPLELLDSSNVLHHIILIHLLTFMMVFSFLRTLIIVILLALNSNLIVFFAKPTTYSFTCPLLKIWVMRLFVSTVH